ncbi:TnsA-like heteromeric transposase endonuclease subunit [Streptomyces erythrochromogenes]|uniref:TnsA-like heteromeric transposase endonuclease subunit n=1 Tax=Streptomyces erythrochromogenes TaxID=285574 RepID=UPI00225B7226|nr:TnsA-like heteromeric transposase endonuclease subunit [Streptomyces erythrochromogenes]MCX5589623.1 TnsA-like heteromeric transposase endonuclease subunit [Streptomyces erythrochromogenes]
MGDVVWAQVRSDAGRLVDRPVSELRQVRLERHEPVWQPERYRGRRAIATWWRLADQAWHVGCGTLQAREAALWLEFDPQVVTFAAWPVRLSWAGSAQSCVPDFFVRMADGQAMLLVCRPGDGTGSRWAQAQELLKAAGQQADWRVRVHDGVEDAVVARNRQRLSRWRHTRLRDAETERILQQVFARPQPFTEGIRASGLPELPTVARALHLIWSRGLLIDWTKPFVPAHSLVWSMGAR